MDVYRYKRLITRTDESVLRSGLDDYDIAGTRVHVLAVDGPYGLTRLNEGYRVVRVRVQDGAFAARRFDKIRAQRSATLFIAHKTPGASQEREVAFVDSMHDKPPDEQRF